MRISDWSSDVCSSDLLLDLVPEENGSEGLRHPVAGLHQPAIAVCMLRLVASAFPVRAELRFGDRRFGAAGEGGRDHPTGIAVAIIAFRHIHFGFGNAAVIARLALTQNPFGYGHVASPEGFEIRDRKSTRL